MFSVSVMEWSHGLIPRVLKLFFANMYHFYHGMLCRIWQFVCLFSRNGTDPGAINAQIRYRAIGSYLILS